jgi:hypothetical protein
VEPVLDMSAVTQAIKTQLQVERQYRQMFGTDLATRPGPDFDERERIMLAEIRAGQAYRAQQAPLALAPLPANYHTLTPEQQCEADLARRRTAMAAQQAAIIA